MLVWWKVKDSSSPGGWALLGFCGGFLSICRWQDIFYLGIPVLFEISRSRNLAPWRRWFVYGGTAALCWVPQIAEWKVIYGRLFTIPQGKDFLHFPPQYMHLVLFSTNHGWFIWTPITALGVLGLFYGARKATAFYWPCLLVIFLEVAVMGSMPTNWHNSESFGIRSLTSCVPLIALGVATLMRDLGRAFQGRAGRIDRALRCLHHLVCGPVQVGSGAQGWNLDHVRSVVGQAVTPAGLPAHVIRPPPDSAEPSRCGPSCPSWLKVSGRDRTGQCYTFALSFRSQLYRRGICLLPAAEQQIPRAATPRFGMTRRKICKLRQHGCPLVAYAVFETILYDGDSMATYLVTGVAGFIGSTLARELLAQGHEVRGLDNFSTGKRENVAEILGQIDLHEADLLDLDALHQACRGVDYVLHQAAIPSVPRSVKDPLGNNRANVDGTLNLLVAAATRRSSAWSMLPRLPPTAILRLCPNGKTCRRIRFLLMP